MRSVNVDTPNRRESPVVPSDSAAFFSSRFSGIFGASLTIDFLRDLDAPSVTIAARTSHFFSKEISLFCPFAFDRTITGIR